LTTSNCTKTIKFLEKERINGEWREDLKFQEIETVSSRFKICPKCNSGEGYWLGMKGDHAYVQCKCCGAKFELYEVHRFHEGSEKPKWLRIFRK
jgi:translation initiation factor 2 beta subunit (eIF-2beta)/eIF-5